MFATTPPSILSHTTPGAQVWDKQANLMRAIKGQDGIQTFIYMNPTGPDDPQNDKLMISGACLQGFDPDYSTLQNSQKYTPQAHDGDQSVCGLDWSRHRWHCVLW